MTTQKEIAMVLDAAAGRAHLVEATPASGKQVWFLAGLLMRAGKDDLHITEGNTNFVLTSRKASFFIDLMLEAAKSEGVAA